MWLEEEVDDGGVVAALHVVVEVGLGVLHASHQVVVEGKGAYLLEELFDGGMLVLDFVVDAEVGGSERIQVFEHAGGGSRGGDEFQQFLAFGGLFVVGGVAVDGFIVHT